MSLATVILIVSLSLLFYKVGISNTGLMIGVICTYFITNFIGGFIFGKVNEKKIFVWCTYWFDLFYCADDNINNLF